MPAGWGSLSILILLAVWCGALPHLRRHKRCERKRITAPRFDPIVSLTLSRFVHQGSVVLLPAWCLAMAYWRLLRDQSHNSHSLFQMWTHTQIYAWRHLNRAAALSNDVIISQHYNQPESHLSDLVSRFVHFKYHTETTSVLVSDQIPMLHTSHTNLLLSHYRI